MREGGIRGEDEARHTCSGKIVKCLIFYTEKTELLLTYILLQLEVSLSFRSRNTKRKSK